MTIPKNNNPKQPDKFRPVMLSSLIMTFFEKIIKDLIVKATEEKLDPLQFTYQAGNNVVDAMLFVVNTLYKYLLLMICNLVF